MPRTSTIQVTPAKGGALMTRPSSDSVGLFNYRVKRDLRRVLDREQTREGYDWFRVHLDRLISKQAILGDPVNLVFQMRGAGGRLCLIAGSRTTLWRLMVLEEFGYVADQDSAHYITPTGLGTPYFDPDIPYVQTSEDPLIETPITFDATDITFDSTQITFDMTELVTGGDSSEYFSGSYIDDEPAEWEVIGSGYSTEGNRWEAINVGLIAVLNNGVDLTVTFDLQETEVKPIYELREQGVARVGTIAEKNGLLVCGDITLVKEDRLSALLTSAEVYGTITDNNMTVRFPHRVLWSALNDPRRFASSAGCAMPFGSKIVTLDYEMKSLEVGQSVIILGAGVNGGNLTTTIEHVAANHLRVAAAAVTAVTDTLISRSDAPDSISAYEDLEDDGSPILRMLPLLDRLIIYRDTTVFIATYTGNPARPFDFVRRDCGKQTAIYYRYTLCSVNWNGQAYHIYAGRGAFFRFDMATQQPVLLTLLDLCSNVMFDQVKIERDGDVFAANNIVTNEILIWFPSASEDKALCLDYKHNTVSTTTMSASAASSIKKPNCGEGAAQQTRDWFVMGTNDGKMLVYGATIEPEPMWDSNVYFLRCGAAYTPMLESGLSDFGDSYNPKEVHGYALTLSTWTGRQDVVFSLLSAPDTNGTLQLVGQATLNDRLAVPVIFLDHYFASRLEFPMTGNKMEVVAQTWEVAGARSDNFEQKTRDA